MPVQNIVVGKLVGASEDGDKNYYNVLIEGKIEKMESVSDHTETLLYFLGHNGDPVYKVPCANCGKLLLVFLRPNPSTGFVPRCC